MEETKNSMKMKNSMKTKNSMNWDREMPYRYWLLHIAGIGSGTVSRLLSYTETAEAAYHMSVKEAQTLLQNAKLDSFLRSRITWDVVGNYEKLQEKGIYLYPKEHPAFPKRLIHIPDAPGWIFVKGRLPNEQKISVAIIGARRCSEYGRYMARQYGEFLGKQDIQVISGMAYGVDGISQRGALAAGGEAFGVLGCGVDICYPKENVDLYEQIMQKGGLISEYLPGTQPKACLFPPRNRIISGLANAVIVIEAKEKSGTLITVDMALEQGREVYALPGRVTDVLSRGCNRLIKQGAGMILSPEDLLFELKGGERSYEMCNYKASMVPTFEKAVAKKVWESLDDYPQSVEMLSKKVKEITMSELLQILIELCISEYACQVSCGCYVRRYG